MFLFTLSRLPGNPSPWQTYTPLSSKINLLGNSPWIFLGFMGIPLPWPWLRMLFSLEEVGKKLMLGQGPGPN